MTLTLEKKFVLDKYEARMEELDKVTRDRGSL